MLIGAHPFDLYGNSTEIEVLERVRTGSTLPLEDVGTRISDSAKDLVSRYFCSTKSWRRRQGFGVVSACFTNSTRVPSLRVLFGEIELVLFQEATEPF